MRLVLTNNGSDPRVGDRPQEQKLRKAITKWEKGKLSERDLKEAETWVSSEVIREQIAAGVEVVTDGQVRWHDPVSHVAGSLENVRVGGLIRFFDTNYLYRQPVVEGEPRWVRPLLAEDAEFAIRCSTRPVKAMITGPYTTARLSVVNEPSLKDDVEKLTMAFTEAFAQEVEAMGQAGVKLIQVDEPMLLQHPEDVGLVRKALGVFAEKRGTAQLGLCTYFGDAAKLYGDFQDMPVEVISFDFTYSEDLISNIEMVGSSKVLGLGLVDGRNTRMDDPENVFRALDRILPKVSADHCYLTTSCGLEYLPRDRARRKLELMTSLRYRYMHAGGQ